MGSPSPRANLLVIRSRDIDRAVEFYQVIGLAFDKHRHGSGPEHYASDADGFVFEIYPNKDGSKSTSSARIGFEVDSPDDLVVELAKIGAEVITPALSSPWGRRAVLRDFDGHTVELTNKNQANKPQHPTA